MSNDGYRWHPENDDWDKNRPDQGPDGGSDQGQSPDQPTFGYFQRPDSDQQYGEYSSYGQFGQASGDYERAPYGGLSKSPFPLHPLSAMEQIDAALRLVRYNPQVLIVLPLIVYLVVGLLSTIVVLIGGESLLTADLLSLEEATVSTEFVITSLLTTVISFIAGLFIYTTAVNAAMSAIYGRKISIGQAVSMSMGDSGRLAIAYVVYAFMFLVVAGLFGFVLTPILTSIGNGGAAIVSLLVLAGSIYLAVRLSCTVPVLVAEQLGPIASIIRSFQLTKGRFWSIFATLMAAVVILLVITIAISLVLAVFSFLSLGSTTGAIIYVTITNALMSAILVAFAQAVSNVIYINLRMIRENFHYEVRGS